MKEFVILDIDHTISDAAWRDSLLGQWDEYHTRSADDKPATDVIELVRMLHAGGCTILAVTARPEKWRSLTYRWLEQHGVMFDRLIMRPDDDYSDAPTVKLAMVETILGPDYPSRVICVLDDREDVIAAFIGKGVTSLKVYGRNYADE